VNGSPPVPASGRTPGAPARSPRHYSLGEEIANSLTHGVGVGLAIAALVLLVAFAVLTHDGYRLASAIAYGVALILAYLASAFYHGVPHPRAKPVLKIIDHCGIYLLIAGTYTPFCLVTLRHANGWWLFGVIWGLAVVGIAAEAFWTYRPRWLSALVYLAMGWLVVVSFGPLVASLAPGGFRLLAAGGLAYTIGTAFYVLQRFRYMHTVWHFWVMAGSACHFLAVLLYVVR
jgi:hemolysin III